MPQVTSLSSWGDLTQHHEKVGKTFILKEAFAADSSRFEKFSHKLKTPSDTEILFDFSKNFITDETIDLLTAVAAEAGVAEKRDAMFRGDKINFTEKRAVLHVALRNVSGLDMKFDGIDVMNCSGGVNEVLNHMHKFSDQVRSGEWKGYTGKKLTNIINIGIGGSDL